MTLDNSGSMALYHNSRTVEYSTPGSYTFVVPQDITSIYFEMIGAGGHGPAGGGGAYWKGFLDVSTLQGDTLEFGVGDVSSNAYGSSSASYIRDATTGVMFLIAGAGGSGGGNVGGGDVSGGNAGAAGTYFSVNGISYYVCVGSVGGSFMDASGGAGGSTNNGGSGGNAGAGGISGNSGSSPNLVTFLPVSTVLGGQSATVGDGNAGGGGYSGGGQGAHVTNTQFGGGGGGSSFYRADYIYLQVAPSTGSALSPYVLSGYGRSGQSGYIGLSYAPSSITTQGDIVCKGQLNVGNILYVSSNSFVDMYGDASTDPKIASGINMNTDTAQLRLYAQNNPYTSVREGTIGIAATSEAGGGWQAPTLTFDSSKNLVRFTPHISGSPMTYDDYGSLTVGGPVTAGSVTSFDGTTKTVAIGQGIQARNAVNAVAGLYLNGDLTGGGAPVVTGGALIVGSSNGNDGSAGVYCAGVKVGSSTAGVGDAVQVQSTAGTIGMYGTGIPGLKIAAVDGSGNAAPLFLNPGALGFPGGGISLGGGSKTILGFAAGAGTINSTTLTLSDALPYTAPSGYTWICTISYTAPISFVSTYNFANQISASAVNGVDILIQQVYSLTAVYNYTCMLIQN